MKYNVYYAIDSRNFKVSFCDEKSADNFYTAMKNADVEAIKMLEDKPVELKLQLVECIFNGRMDNLYTYVYVNKPVKQNQAVIVQVRDWITGFEGEKLAVAINVQPATIEDVRQAAAAIGRKKLSRIKEVFK